jgi:hypothetical protein
MLAIDILRANEIVPPVPERRRNALRSPVKEDEEGDKETGFAVRTRKRKRGYATSTEDEEPEYDQMEDGGDDDDIRVEDEKQEEDNDEEDIKVGDGINVGNGGRHGGRIKTRGGPTIAEKRARVKLLRVSIIP